MPSRSVNSDDAWQARREVTAPSDSRAGPHSVAPPDFSSGFSQAFGPAGWPSGPFGSAPWLAQGAQGQFPFAGWGNGGWGAPQWGLPPSQSRAAHTASAPGQQAFSPPQIASPGGPASAWAHAGAGDPAMDSYEDTAIIGSPSQFSEEEEPTEDCVPPQGEPHSYTFSEALGHLSGAVPSAVSQREAQPALQSSLSCILGRTPKGAAGSSSFLLNEADLVGQALDAAQRLARKGAPASQPGSLQEVQGAGLSFNSFIRSVNKGPMGKLFAHSKLPSSATEVSRDDMLLLPSRDGNPKSVLRDKSLAGFEAAAIHALEATSMMDSFLGGLGSTMKGLLLHDPQSEQTHFDAQAALSFFEAMSEAITFSASTLASLHTNLVMARRDSFLAQSRFSRERDLCASMRSLPVSQGSLFGGAVSAAIEERKKIEALSLKPRSSGSGKPGRSRQLFPQPSSGPPAKKAKVDQDFQRKPSPAGRGRGARGRGRARPSAPAPQPQ